MTPVIYWFRNDLRLPDNAAFTAACRAGAPLLPVYCHDPKGDALTAWGCVRVGPHRRHFLAATLGDLAGQLRAQGSDLLELSGPPAEVLPALAHAIGARQVFCEAIAAPEEAAELAALGRAGLAVDSRWQSSLLDPAALPFPVSQLPGLFTAFRQGVESAGLVPAAPLPLPASIPAPPNLPPSFVRPGAAPVPPKLAADPRSSFPYQSTAFAGGETAAKAHLKRYFGQNLAHHYKDTRDGLSGTDYSSKFSPWLALGALSARSAYAALREFEAAEGANKGTYWLWFELLWRDYFRFLHLQHGQQLYSGRGLSELPMPLAAPAPLAFSHWCCGTTGEALVDAAMRDLAATGYLSNRLRQVAASYLIHELAGDWRAGAAWFEAQLIDYDVYSNQGNWLYIAGRGTDPRGGRRFNPQKQAREHDPDGRYRQAWGCSSEL